ncbi:hypothetical protein ACEPAF_7372 [Sanghuangporus sanghuang]
MASPPSASKMHASPSKGASSSAAALTSANRTYDAKLVQREMLRLGTALGALSSSTAAVLTSGSPLTLPTAVAGATGASGSAHGHGHVLGHALVHGHGGNAGITSGTDGGAWTQLHVYVLPLFNHEQLQYPIEDLNALVRRHIEVVMSAGPSRALSTLEVDVAELIGGGMTTLNAKLAGVEDDKLPARVVELWTFFWDQVLPYVEGIFIPLQTHPLLLSLHRTPKPHRPASPTNLASPNDVAPGAAALSPIDVRTIALRAFRDKIVVPIAPRLEARLLAMRPGGSFSSSTSVPGMPSAAEVSSYQHPRLQQMLLVLHSQAQRVRPPLSLTAPPPSLSPQELAIRRLLDALTAHLRPVSAPGSSTNGNVNSPLNTLRHRRAPSFLSGGTPRDRRGRIGIGINDADTDKENSKRRGRYIDDSMYPAHMPTGSLSTMSSSHTINVGESSLANRRRMRRYHATEMDDESRNRDSGSWDGETGGGTTPRGRFSADRERERNFLESLRSPGPVEDDDNDSTPPSFANFQNQDGSAPVETNGNVNVFPRREDSLPAPAPPPKDHDVFPPTSQMSNGHRVSEQLDWDSAQAAIERMVGMGNTVSDLDLNRNESVLQTQMHPQPLAPSPVPGAIPGPGPPAPDSRRRRMT